MLNYKKGFLSHPWLLWGGAAVVLLVILPGIILISGLASKGTGVMSLRAATAPGQAAAYDEMAVPMTATDAVYVGKANVETGRVSPPSPVMPPTGGETAAEVDQKIIKNASLELIVDHADEAAARIAALAAERGGFVQESSLSEREDSTKYGRVTVRVPADKFEDLLAAIRPLAQVVRNESVTGQDVTEQYTDLEARLRNAQAQEKTYLIILDRAKTVEDTLKVQAQLGAIRETIERYEGQIKYLTNVTGYSTVSVSLSEEPVVRIAGREFRPGTAVKEAAQTLVSAFQGIFISFIWAVIVGGGVLLPIAALVWLVVWLVQSRRSRRK